MWFLPLQSMAFPLCPHSKNAAPHWTSLALISEISSSLVTLIHQYPSTVKIIHIFHHSLNPQKHPACFLHKLLVLTFKTLRGFPLHFCAFILLYPSKPLTVQVTTTFLLPEITPFLLPAPSTGNCHQRTYMRITTPNFFLQIPPLNSPLLWSFWDNYLVLIPYLTNLSQCFFSEIHCHLTPTAYNFPLYTHRQAKENT